MSTSVSPAMRRILKAREAVARRNVFFASILYTARLVETTAAPGGNKTMFTNGMDIFFHPEFVKENDSHIEGVLLHEVLHCALNHVGRRGHRDAIAVGPTGQMVSIWNLATDYALNPLITGIYTLPKGALIDQKWHGMSAEKIYEELKKQIEKNGKCMVAEGSGPMQQPTPEEQEEHEQEWRRAVKIAAEKAEQAGTMHGQLKRLIEELFPAERLDWRKLLDDMARNARSEDNASWHRPNRRFLGDDMILPGRDNDKIFRLVVCLDTSGSISDEILKEMKSEVMNLLDQKIITTAVIISTDTKVRNQQEVDDAEGVKNFDLGNCGGGTCFDEAMKAVAKVDHAIGCVFLTDMATSSFGKDPGIDTIWVDWTKQGNQAVPFGRVTVY